MKKFTAWLMVVVLIMGCLSAMSAASADETLKAWTTKKIKMFDDMSTYANVMVKIPAGKKVTVYDYFYGSEWASVSWKGYYGFVKVSHLTFKKPSPTPKPTPKPTAKPHPSAKPTAPPVPYEDFRQVDYFVKVTLQSADSHVNMRWQPSTGSDVIGVYADGTCLEALQVSSSWTQVMDHDTNRVGYIMNKFLVESEIPAEEEEVEPTDTELVVSPVNEMDSLETLQAALPYVYLLPAPEGAENITYCWIHGEPTIAQMEFTYGGVEYTLRAAECESEDEEADIDGIYLPMHEEEENDGIHVMLDDEGVYAVAHFYSAEHMTQYALMGETSDAAVSTLEELAKAVFPAA
ncbi:MAG: SH3 domain-containing protein [Clostridia bacterium]|nr:SH3 domain-containing protein [Clostridia bacterium]